MGDLRAGVEGTEILDTLVAFDDIVVDCDCEGGSLRTGASNGISRGECALDVGAELARELD